MSEVRHGDPDTGEQPRRIMAQVRHHMVVRCIYIFPSGNTINFISPENKVTQTRLLYDLGRDNADQVTPTLKVSYCIMLKGCLNSPRRDQCLFPSPALLRMSALSRPMAGIPEPLSRRHNSDYTCNPARSQAPS